MPTSESGDQKSEAEPETGPETGPDTESEMDTLPSSSSHLTSGQLQAVDLKDIASSLDKSMEVTDLGEIEASLTAGQGRWKPCQLLSLSLSLSLSVVIRLKQIEGMAIKMLQPIKKKN